MTPKATWRETVSDGEEAGFEKLAQALAAMQAARAQKHGQALRALHAKGHLGLIGHFTVDEKLPDHARQGMFAQPGKHRAYIRFSNGSGGRVKDGAPDVRGMAVKVLGIEGDKLLFAAGTQDWLAIDATRTPVRNPTEFVAVIRGIADDKLLGTMVRELGLGRALGIAGRALRDLKGRPNDLLDVTFNTVLPVAWGPYAARLAFVPLHAPSAARGRASSADFIGERMAERAGREPLRWEARAQFFTGESTPIEDPSVAWDSPFERVGELVSVPVEANSERGRALADYVERLSFDPWHALREHRPLGAMMRARKVAYLPSTTARKAASEPDGSEWEKYLPGPQAA